MQRLSPKYKRTLWESIEKIKDYLKEEWLEVTQTSQTIWEYELQSFTLQDVGVIQFFHRYKRERKLYFYPSFFADIYIEKELLDTNESTKKVIFLLSNIFECFDEFEERNTMIEYHKDIYETVNNKKIYSLRHDFIDINSLSQLYSETDIARKLETFIKKNKSIMYMSHIKDKFPDIYRTLLYFLYNIFALEKSLKTTQKKLKELYDFQEKSGENMHIELSEKRLEYNRNSLEKTLEIYKKNFENFMNIMMQK